MVDSELSPRLYFSYGQFFIYDETVRLPGCDWTDEHMAQGFARRESVANVLALLEFGHADVRVHRRPPDRIDDFERVIAVPFQVSSGTVLIDGPEESDVRRAVSLARGHYRLVVGQRVTGNDEEEIVLFFERLPSALSCSEVVIADYALAPALPLLETAGVAGHE